jgi:hypothetical protein
MNNLNFTSYLNFDFPDWILNRKITRETCQLLGHALVSSSSKNQNSMATSIVKVEYIIVVSCRAYILWMKQTLKDFGLKLDHIPIFCYYTSAINLFKNPIQQS